jgi:hypothetical protein
MATLHFFPRHMGNSPAVVKMRLTKRKNQKLFKSSFHDLVIHLTKY